MASAQTNLANDTLKGAAKARCTQSQAAKLGAKPRSAQSVGMSLQRTLCFVPALRNPSDGQKAEKAYPFPRPDVRDTTFGNLGSWGEKGWLDA